MRYGFTLKIAAKPLQMETLLLTVYKKLPPPYPKVYNRRLSTTYRLAIIPYDWYI